MGKRLLSGILAAALVCTSLLPSTAKAAKYDGPSEHPFSGEWIWSEDEKTQGQWMNLRKTFTLSQVPGKVEARIAADSKYWLWINGTQVVYEGMVKTGPNRTDMYYDTVDITSYLKAGENTIAAQVVYFGKSGYGFKDSQVPGFLFEADFGENALTDGAKIISDSSWKVKKDPAYQEHEIKPNYRLAEPNILYNAQDEMVGWQNPEFDDSGWEDAAEWDMEIKKPYENLWERPIPQLKIGEITKYTKDGADGTGTWKVEDIESWANDKFTALSLPDEYTVDMEFMVEPTAVPPNLGNVPYTGAVGLAVAMKDGDNFYMPQVNMADLNGNNSKDYAIYKPHLRINGQWQVKGPYDISNVIGGNQRFDTKHKITVNVDAKGFDTTVDGKPMERINATELTGGSIGFRTDGLEKVRIYNLEVKSADNQTTLFEDSFATDKPGKRMTQFLKLSGNVAPEIKVDEENVPYLYLNDSIIKAGTVELGENVKRYTIRNATNLQGTPYLKVKAEAGKRIDMYTDTWKETANNGDSIRHAYITKDGEQEFEALGWVNGYDVYFEVPESVEVLELGFRTSTYQTEPAGSFTSEDADLNKLYQKSYDTLLVTMRDNYMDCPDRERAQWWGDAINEMQMAFYAMDSNAGLLYKKTLNQTLGWKNDEGRLPTTAPNGVDAISELPMQALAGVMSFWQYFMYSADDQPIKDGYDSLLQYLKLWSVEADGFVSHRGGTWDWMDWGDHADGKIIEQSWYYIALDSVLKMAQYLDKPAEDIEFLENRMAGIAKQYDQAFWNESQKAYYHSVDNGQADDRANALAVYAGLAPQKRYADIAALLQTRMQASPYMEKYVLEALNMMGYDDQAMARTKIRYRAMIDDEFPTLWEFWNKNAGTKNHAWSGGPLTMMYMFQAGITPLTAGYETFQIRPLTAGLKDIQASIPSPNGNISVSIKEEGETTALTVTVPEQASSADIYVPRLDQKQTKISLNGEVIYENGIPSGALPAGVTYLDEDQRFVAFRVTAGTYQFASSEETAIDKEQYNLDVKKQGEGTISVDQVEILELPYHTALNKGQTVTVSATPAEGWFLKKIIGTYPVDIAKNDQANTYLRQFTMDRDINFTAVFEELPKEKHLISINATGKEYTVEAKVNGIARTLPYTVLAEEGKELAVEIAIVTPENYKFGSWTSGAEAGAGAKTTIVVGDEDMTAAFTVDDLVTRIKPIGVVTADNPGGTGAWDMSKMVDGQRISTESSNGFTTNTYDTKDISATPHTIKLDMGMEKDINQIALFPRSNAAAGENLSCGFPVNFQILVSKDDKEYQKIKDIKDFPNPRFKQQTFNFPDKKARYIKIVTTKLGAVAMDEQKPTNFRLQLAEIELYNNPAVKEIPVLEKVAAETGKTELFWDEKTSVTKVTGTDENGQVKDLKEAEITYSSDKKEVAAVDEKGAITAKNAGKATITVSVTLDKVTATDTVEITVKEPQPLAPVKTAVTTTSVTLKAIAGYEYAIATGNAAPVFGSKSAFTNLKSNTEYTFYQRIASNANHGAGMTSASLKVTTIKETVVPEALLGTISIQGTPNEGQTLTVNTAGIRNQNPGRLTILWKRDSQVIPNVTGTSYRLTKADVGYRISVVVSAQNLSGSLSAATASNIGAAPIAAPKDMKLSASKKTLKVKDKYTLKAAFVPATATNAKLNWKSSNSKVALVSSKGLVTAKSAGKATITLSTSNGIKKSCQITVIAAPTRIKLNVTSKTLGIKENYTLKTTLVPANAIAQKLTFKSSNTKVASVNSKGKVTAKKTGKATITVTTANGKKASSTIYVKKAPSTIKLNARTKTIKAKGTYRIKATLSKGSAGTVSYTSSNKKIAVVDSNGKVKALKKGKVTITAKAYNGKKAAMTIIVK